jgi:uncharacterized repeat protein (TIGR02543 family)
MRHLHSRSAWRLWLRASGGRADDRRIADRRDVRGPLDIASVSQAQVGDFASHTLQTYRPFASRLLTGRNLIAFEIDTNADSRLDRTALIFWYRGLLRGVVANGKGKLVAQFHVGRPDRRSVRAELPLRALGDPTSYDWLALSSYRSKRICRRGCLDLAPNSGMITHQLAQPAVSVEVSGNGRVTSSPQGIDCPQACSAKYWQGTNVTLAAAPAENWVFSGWSGACTGTGPCNLRMDAAESVKATFVPTYVLTVSAASPGFVKINPPDTPCGGGPPCTQRYEGGTVVTLTADSTDWYTFDGWSGACSGTSPTCTVTMDGDKTVAASFSLRSFSLTVAMDVQPGAAARVTSSPPGIDCPGDCSESNTAETWVTLTAVPGAGSVFTGWDSIWCRGLMPTCLFAMGSVFPEDKSVIASFGRRVEPVLGSGASENLPREPAFGRRQRRLRRGGRERRQGDLAPPAADQDGVDDQMSGPSP